MKPSHLRTPRTLDEGHFVPGYRCAEDRDDVAEIGHKMLTYLCVAILVVAVPMVILGVL